MFNDSGNGIWHATFNACAKSLTWAAGKLDPFWPGGLDYVKLNVILFCVVLLASLALNLAFVLGWL